MSQTEGTQARRHEGMKGMVGPCVPSCLPHFVPLLLLQAMAGGCGYTRSGDLSPEQGGYRWRSLYRQDVQTVAVPVFTNKTFHRGLETSLTKAVIHRLESQAPYKVVPRERADTVLEGHIVEAQVATVNQDKRFSLPQEQLMTLAVDFVWKDLRNGRILVQRRQFEQTATYYPTLGEGTFVGSQQAVERLALGIVRELQADW